MFDSVNSSFNLIDIIEGLNKCGFNKFKQDNNKKTQWICIFYWRICDSRGAPSIELQQITEMFSSKNFAVQPKKEKKY